MLQIIVDQTSLDLPENIQIDLTIENPFLQPDRIPIPYTLTFNLDETPKNVRKLKYPNRVTAQNGSSEEDCIVKFSKLAFLTGKLVVISFDDGRINTSFRGISTLSNLKKKLNTLELAEETFGAAELNTIVRPGRYQYKWKIDYNDFFNFGRIYSLMATEAGNGVKDNFVIAPVKVKGEEFLFEENASGQARNKFGKNAANMYFNWWNAQNHNSILQRTADDNVNGRRMEHAPIFPFPYIEYIFDELFGNLLYTNPFSFGELQDLVLCTSFHPNYFKKYNDLRTDEFTGMLFDNSTDQTAAFLPSFKLNSFIGDIDSNELLKSIMKMFCMSIFPKFGRFEILYNKDILNDNEVENWSDKLIGELGIYKTDAQNYKFGYDDLRDETVAVRPEDHVANIKALIDAAVDPNLGSLTVRIDTTGEYYKKEVIDGAPVYTTLASGLSGNEDVDNAYDSSSKVTPLPMSINQYWTNIQAVSTDVPVMKSWYVPEWSGDRMVKDTLAHVMFYRGLRATFQGSGETYPLLTATNYDHFGNRVGDYSLAWNGDDGLINKFHNEFKAYLARPKIRISGDFRLSVSDIKMLNMAKKKNIKGRNFFIEKIQISFTKYEILDAQVDLIEA